MIQSTLERGKLLAKKRQTCGKYASWAGNVSLTNFVIGCAKPQPDGPAAAYRAIVMPLHTEQVHWMPSPPLAPDDGPIDLVHLRQMTLGDRGLEREVLAMFAAQSVCLMEQLAAEPADASELAHKLKGSAQAIGAFRVADAAEWLQTSLRTDDEPTEALLVLSAVLAETRSAIDGMLRRS